MTSKLHHLSKKKKRLFNKAKKSKSKIDWERYARFRNQCTEAFKKAKIEFFHKKLSELNKEGNGSRRWWSKVKALAHIETPKESIPDLDSDNGPISSLVGKANTFARFFCNAMYR